MGYANALMNQDKVFRMSASLTALLVGAVTTEVVCSISGWTLCDI